ncbi:MAG: TMEM165/GDT1 family protein [Planctomycetota bacterium]
METKSFITIFFSILVLEIGDKTQIATLLYASKDKQGLLAVFAAASLALVVAAGVGVLAGAQMGKWLSPAALRWIGGLGFIAVGIWTLLGSER